MSYKKVRWVLVAHTPNHQLPTGIMVCTTLYLAVFSTLLAFCQAHGNTGGKSLQELCAAWVAFERGTQMGNSVLTECCRTRTILATRVWEGVVHFFIFFVQTMVLLRTATNDIPIICRGQYLEIHSSPLSIKHSLEPHL